MVRFTSGDLFETPADLRVNTVNCVGVMGAGVALAFKNRYPEMFRDYKAACDAGELRPGKLHVWKNLTGDWVVNFPTKRHWKEKSRYEDIEAGLVAFSDYLRKQGAVRVTIPALGCGHGGLDWERVAPMIRSHLETVEAEVFVFEPADSRAVGKKMAEELFGTLRTYLESDADFSPALRRLGVHQVRAAGGGAPSRLLADVTIALSQKPTDREQAAALSFVDELAKPGFTFAFVVGTAISTKLVSTALSKGANVAAWVPQGLLHFHLPQILRTAFDEGDLTLFSLAAPEQGWNPRLSRQSTLASLASARASLVTDPEPAWLSEFARESLPGTKAAIFYIRYQSTASEYENLWTEVSAHPVGRRSVDGKPNVAPILSKLEPSPPKESRQDLANAGHAPSPVAEVGVPRDQVAGQATKRPQKVTPYPKRLIEVDLPIKRISAHARREKSIRHGHISALHIWWARRPLAACRAVTCAALWPDPKDENCPPEFRAIAADLMYAWAREQAARGSEESAPTWTLIRQLTSAFALCNHPTTLRQSLLDFIGDFANWDNSTVAEYIETARMLTAASNWSLSLPPPTEQRFLGWPGSERWLESVAGWKRLAGEHPRPLVVDPFAGGGSIPLEALRIGADVFASDLNPLPILLNRVVLEYIPRHGQRLADEVRKWGEWIKDEAEKELTGFYPKDADGSTPVAYLWARTITCEGPACGAKVPLVRSPWLSKKANRPVALQIVPNVETKTISLRIIAKQRDGWVAQEDPAQVFPTPNFEPTVKRGSATCPCCGFTTPVARVREQMKAQRGGANDALLMCIVTTRKGESGRSYRLPRGSDYSAIEAAVRKLDKILAERADPLVAVPNEIISSNELRRISVPLYGMITWGDLFSKRQALTLVTISRLTRDAMRQVGSKESGELATAVGAILGLALSRLADISNALCTWMPGTTQAAHLFARQAIPMTWDFVETSPLSDGAAGDYGTTVRNMVRVLEEQPSFDQPGHAELASATSHPLPDDSAVAVITDPPYYDAVPYAHLSDFFYVWLRRVLRESHADLFTGEAVKKSEEIVVDRPHELSNSTHDIAFYERELTRAFAEARRVVRPDGIGTIVFASKSTASWEAILKAVIEADWVVTGSWPVDTEREARISAQDQARLGSSVHLVCRPRENSDGSVRINDIGDWRDVLQALPIRIHEWMPRLAKEGVVGADAIFACLGPALEIFSQYKRVERADGSTVPLREFLEHVWAAVSKEALSMVFEGADATGFEEDARLTAMWLWTLNAHQLGDGTAESDEDAETGDDERSTKPKSKGGFALEFDAARKIAQGLGAHLEDLANLVEVVADIARLLPVAERTAYLFGKDQASAPVAPRGRKKDDQLKFDLFQELTQSATAEVAWGEKAVTKPGETTLDRVHQSMILFAAGRGEALRRFLVDDGAGKDQRFWRLSQALSALYPKASDEKRWIDGVLARKKGLGL